MANLNGVGSFHEFHEFQRFRWKYGQLTWTASCVSTSSTSFKEDFVESMANLNVNGVMRFHEFHEFPRRFRWKYGQLERGREFPRVPRVSKKISLKVWPTWMGSGVSTSFKEDFVESMANLNGVRSFHEFQRRFRWKYGQLERGREFPRVPRVSKISLKVWPTNVNGVMRFHEFHEFPRRFRWKYGQIERGREFPRVPRVSKKISLKVWPTWMGSGVSTSSTSFREDFVESMANVSKKISLKVWPTWTGSGVSTSFKEDFVESMANVNDHQPLFESKERQRSYVTIINHFLRAKNGKVAWKWKKMAYVSFPG